MTAVSVLLTAEIESAIATVDDPEFPGVSIVELGLLESIDITGTEVLVGLVPTFSGCPALDVIREDVAAAVMAMPGITNVDVKFFILCPSISCAASALVTCTPVRREIN